MTQFPPRIHVLLARHAPVGLVIRRGPSKSVATLLWDRQRDEFHLGQWLRGRIYERRCDLSPDGKYFIYFAMNGKWNSEVRGSWTAISKAPYLKALALFPKGDCWFGGGLWTGKTTYWLNGGCYPALLNTTLVQQDSSYQPVGSRGGECLSVYYPRLLREGWILVEQTRPRKHQNIDIFEKPMGQGWILRKIAHAEIGAPPGKGCYWDEHELVHAASGRVISCPDWEWADLDGKRLAWATGGKLFSAKVTEGGLMAERELFDFSEMTFTAVEAPY